MGRGMVKNIVQKGSLTSPIILYNRTTSRSTDLQSSLGGSSKATIAKTISEAVQPADIIFTCVGDDAAINSTIDSALSSGSVKGKLFVDCSTVHPDTTEALSKKVLAADATFVACPVFGAPAMADSGNLVCVLAGPADQVDRVKPYCKGVMGRAEIDYSGQSVGKATLMKIIGNTFVLQMVETLGMGHTLAEKTGLGVENLHAFVETMFPGPFTAYSTRLMSGDYYHRDEPLFAAKLARKDAKHALALAESAGAKIRAVELVNEHIEKVVEEKGDKGDIAGIYGAVRMENGLEFGNGK